MKVIVLSVKNILLPQKLMAAASRAEAFSRKYLVFKSI